MELLVFVIMASLALFAFVAFDVIFAVLISVYHWFKKENEKDTCDIITPLNTYNNVDCNTVCFYDKHITFKYEDGVTVEVAASTANIKFHSNK